MKKIISFCLLFIFCGIINVNAATTYKVNYVLSGGTNNKKNIVEYSSLKENFVLLSPSRAGYTFDGWYTDKALTKKVESIPKGSTGNKTYYAKWIVNTYSIKFSGNGAQSGSMARRNNLRYDKNYILAANTFVRKGYKFTGWNTNAKGTGKTYLDKATVGQVSKVNGGVVTLYAQWQIVNYGITYNLNGGTNNKNNPKTYNVETEVVYNNPTKTGYTFDGWYSDAEFTKKVEKISKGSAGKRTVYAKWIVNTYTIKYSGNGAESGSMPRRTNLRYDKNYILNENTFKRTGYKFNGWNTNANGTGKTYADKATVGQVSKVNGGVVTLYAMWKKIDYSITYNLNGGTNNKNNPTNYDQDMEIVLNNPTKTGYTFDGWYTDSNFTNKITSIAKGSTGNKTVYAKWIVNTYTIKYSGNGAESGTMPRRTNLRYDKNYILDENKFIKDGFVFEGWNTNANGTGKIYADKEKVCGVSKVNGGVVTLYAMWALAPPRFEVENIVSGTTGIIIYNNSYTNQYFIYRSKTVDGDYELIGTKVPESYNITIYEDNSITPGQTYYYKLEAGNWRGRSKMSLSVKSVTLTSSLSRLEQAVSKAKLILKNDSFSKLRLLNEVKNNGFTDVEATYAVDNCDANWNEQAVLVAEEQLKYFQDISKNGLIDILENDLFEHDEAVYAANNVNVNWKNHALLRAKNYETHPEWYGYFSKNLLIIDLKDDGFTEEEAIYAANNCDANWERNALLAAKRRIKDDKISKNKLIDYLENIILFTHSEALYAANNCGGDWQENALEYAKNSKTSKAKTIDALSDAGYTESDIDYAIANCGVNWNTNAINETIKYAGENSGTFYSKNTVVNQLKYQKYTDEEILYAVNNCGINWNNNAVIKANEYIETYDTNHSYSRNYVISMLKLYEFTEEEAIYGVDNCGENWNNHAITAAILYPDNTLSRTELIQYLTFDYYTQDEATYGVDNSGINWNNNATLRAKDFIKNGTYSTRELLIQDLMYYGFTEDEAIYGVDHSGYSWD